MKFCRDVTDGGDFVLVWTPSVQDTLRRIFQFFDCIKSHALNKCTFNLRQNKKQNLEFPCMRKYSQQEPFNVMLFIWIFKTQCRRVFSMSWGMSLKVYLKAYLKAFLNILQALNSKLKALSSNLSLTLECQGL